MAKRLYAPPYWPFLSQSWHSNVQQPGNHHHPFVTNQVCAWDIPCPWPPCHCYNLGTLSITSIDFVNTLSSCNISKFLFQNKFLAQKFFEPKNISNLNRFLIWKKIVKEKNFWSEKELVKKIVCPKKNWSKKNFC